MAVAHPDPGIVDELVHAVEAETDLYLAVDPEKAAVVLAGSPSMRGLAHSPGVAVVGVAADHDLPAVAREAIRFGAHDLVCWPGDRHAFRTILREAASRARLALGGAEGRIVAVAGARGGAGTTTVAAMLARAIEDAVVVDLDVAGAGQAAFLVEGAEPTLGHVLAAVDDLDPRGLAAALVPHASGRALCPAPRSSPPDREQAERLVVLLRASVPVAVCDLGRADSDAGRAVLAAADAVLCVCAPDVASMRGARALAASSTRIRVVLNQATRTRLSARDVARVLGERPAAVIATDAAIRRAGEAGRLPRRGPGRRSIGKLAAALTRSASDGS